MKINKLYKILSVAIMVFFILNIAFNILSFAEGKDYYEIDRFEEGETSAASDMIRKGAGTVIVATRYICVVIAVIILLVISMKYMIAAPGDRADIKKHAIPYAIGVIILFGASGILTIIQNVAKILE